MSPSLAIIDLGVMPYAPALELQRAVAKARIDGTVANDVLLLVEHPPVVTLGRGSKDAAFVASRDLLVAKGVELFEVERGGDVTFHGPGQLVGYPIMDLKRHRQDLHWYLRQVEESLIVALSRFRLEAVRNPGYTGVWTGGVAEAAHGSISSPECVSAATGGIAEGDGSTQANTGLRKIASIGVHARDWITWHGFALNVITDLSYFDLIVPCGIRGVEMTSLERELRRDDLTVLEVGHVAGEAFAQVFSLEPVEPSNDSVLGKLVSQHRAADTVLNATSF